MKRDQTGLRSGLKRKEIVFLDPKKTRFLLKQSHSILAQNNGTILRWGEFGVALPQAGGRAAHAPTRTVKL